MLNLKNYAENHGEKLIFVFVLIDLKRENKEDIVIVMKAKNCTNRQHLRRRLFVYINVLFNKSREDLEKRGELASLPNQVKIVRLLDELGEQNFHEDKKKVLEPVTKSFQKTS